ncbi:hypothetical protein DVH05_017468 [Phytophthora capsici]|nr:hypothetical protein DVH05_017468 [Phytophthora capsici]
MKIFLTIVAAFAIVGALAAAEEPVKDTEVGPDSIDEDSPENHEYHGGGFRGGYGGGFGGGYGYRRGWGGGYRRYGYRNW